MFFIFDYTAVDILWRSYRHLLFQLYPSITWARRTSKVEWKECHPSAAPSVVESKVRNQKPGSQNKKCGDSGKDGRNERQT